MQTFLGRLPWFSLSWPNFLHPENLTDSWIGSKHMACTPSTLLSAVSSITATQFIRPTGTQLGAKFIRKTTTVLQHDYLIGCQCCRPPLAGQFGQPLQPPTLPKALHWLGEQMKTILMATNNQCGLTVCKARLFAKHCTVDSWTTRVGAAWVRLYAEFFQII